MFSTCDEVVTEIGRIVGEQPAAWKERVREQKKHDQQGLFQILRQGIICDVRTCVVLLQAIGGLQQKEEVSPLFLVHGREGEQDHAGLELVEHHLHQETQKVGEGGQSNQIKLIINNQSMVHLHGIIFGDPGSLCQRPCRQKQRVCAWWWWSSRMTTLIRVRLDGIRFEREGEMERVASNAYEVNMRQIRS